jgi:hypothetical protein
LSIIDNLEGTMQFFDNIKKAAHSQRVFVDLSQVTTITPEAITGLLATIHIPRALISGNVPNDAKAAQMINSSGFREYVRSEKGYQSVDLHGRVHSAKGVREVSEIRFNQVRAESLALFAIKALGGPPPPPGPSYDIFCEGMLNTLTHARWKSGHRETWWASTYVDADGKRACFTFIDQGVGIFGSQRFWTRIQIDSLLGGLTKGDFLLRLLKGEIPSSTRFPGRGNGIPEMYDHCKAGRIQNLKILSGDALADAETDTYRRLPTSFVGTLLYWEVRKSDDNDHASV